LRERARVRANGFIAKFTLASFLILGLLQIVIEETIVM
jgi:hypothetical protein